MAGTLRALILCASPLGGSYTVREHLLATDCDNLGSGDSGIQVPISIVTEDIPIAITEVQQLEVVLEAEEVKVKVSELQIGIDIIPIEVKTTIKDC